MATVDLEGMSGISIVNVKVRCTTH